MPYGYSLATLDEVTTRDIAEIIKLAASYFKKQQNGLPKQIEETELYRIGGTKFRDFTKLVEENTGELFILFTAGNLEYADYKLKIAKGEAPKKDVDDAFLYDQMFVAQSFDGYVEKNLSRQQKNGTNVAFFDEASQRISARLRGEETDADPVKNTIPVVGSEAVKPIEESDWVGGWG